MENCLCQEIMNDKKLKQLKCLGCKKKFGEQRWGVIKNRKLYVCGEEGCIEYMLGIFTREEWYRDIMCDVDEHMCTRNDCNNAVRCCHKCWLFHYRNDKELPCTECKKWLSGIEECTMNELNKITTNGYNTFGDVGQIVIDYLV